MFTAAAKTLLKNHIRHADTHNRMVEESEMWACHRKLSNIDNRRDNTDKRRTRDERTNYRYAHRRQSNPFTGRNDSQASFLYDQRDASESPEDRGGAYMDRQETEIRVSRKEWKANQDLKTGIDRWDHSGYEKQNLNRKPRRVEDGERWGHSGYKMMYPGDFDSDTSDNQRKKRKREKNNKRKNKKYKKRKKKRKNKDSEDRKKKSENDHSVADQVKTETSGLKNNSDLLLMQRFNRETRPRKPSQPRMKMRTWNSDSSADSDDNRDRKIKSGKHQKGKTQGNRSDESSVDSSYDSDSDSEREDRHRKRKKVKARRKRKRHHENDETSDSGEDYPSSRKRVCSSRTASSSDSAEEYSGKLMSDKQYSQRRYSENSDLTDNSDSNRKRKNDTDYSNTKKHKKKKKKHRYK